MQDSGFSFFAQQLVAQIPVLLVAFIGLVLSFVFLARCRWPAVLTMLATGIVLITAFVVTGAQAYVFASRTSMGLTAENYAQLASGVGWVGSFARALALGLLLAAVFMGRKRPVVQAP
jgi:hypothetical protein